MSIINLQYPPYQDGINPPRFWPLVKMPEEGYVTPLGFKLTAHNGFPNLYHVPFNVAGQIKPKTRYRIKAGSKPSER